MQQTSVSQLETILVNFFDSLQAEEANFHPCSVIESAEPETENEHNSLMSSLSLLHLASALNMPTLVGRFLIHFSKGIFFDSRVSVKGHEHELLIDKHGASALDWALALGHFEVAAVLREHYNKRQSESQKKEKHLGNDCAAKSVATSIVIDQPLLSSASRQQQMASESLYAENKKEVVVKMEKEEEEEEDILLDNVSL